MSEKTDFSNILCALALNFNILGLAKFHFFRIKKIVTNPLYLPLFSFLSFCAIFFYYFKSMITAKPFIKWVGGKTQLLDEIRKYYPSRIEKYCEPFVGGGAVLFDVLSRANPEEVLINDING